MKVTTQAAVSVKCTKNQHNSIISAVDQVKYRIGIRRSLCYLCFIYYVYCLSNNKKCNLWLTCHIWLAAVLKECMHR